MVEAAQTKALCGGVGVANLIVATIFYHFGGGGLVFKILAEIHNLYLDFIKFTVK